MAESPSNEVTTICKQITPLNFVPSFKSTLTDPINYKFESNPVNLDNYTAYDTLKELLKKEYNDRFKVEDIKPYIYINLQFKYL